MSKYYAVKNGRKIGVFLTWDECKAQVEKYSGAEYKSFSTMDEANAYLMGDDDLDFNENESYAFVDGSYNPVTKVYGYGGFLVHGGNRYELMGAGDDEEMASMRNVAGEIEGSMAAVKKAMELGIKKLVIYYDYMGIEKWALGEWKRNKKGTMAYYDFIQSIKNEIVIAFRKVKAHSNIAGNEEADRLAKEAVGVSE